MLQVTTVDTSANCSTTNAYLRKHPEDAAGFDAFRENLVKGLDPCKASKRNSCMLRQPVILSLIIFCGLILLLTWQRTPTPNAFHYEKRFASTFESNSSILRVEAELQPTLSNYAFNNPECDYTKGRWVWGESGPLYSGTECAWLDETWACRRSNRTDFDYENYRWQPDDCDMPTFDRESFLKRMENRIFAFIGDSLGRQQFQSLLCLITCGKNDLDVLDASAEFGLTQAPRTLRPDGWAYRFNRTNTTILFYWSATLSDIQPFNQSDPRTKKAVHMDRPPLFLKKYFPRFDVLILNTGSHWNAGKFKKNHWKMYVAGKRLSSTHALRDLKKARNFTVHSILRWVDEQLENTSIQAFFRTMSPRHFTYGDWNTGGRCDNTHLRREGQLMKGPVIDKAAERAARNNRVKLLNVTLMSHFRDEAHISKFSWKSRNGSQDCVHWCLPGVPDTWNQILYAQLLQAEASLHTTTVGIQAAPTTMAASTLAI